LDSLSSATCHITACLPFSNISEVTLIIVTKITYHVIPRHRN